MAARTAQEAYEAHVGALLTKVWDREGETLVFNPVDLNTPLSAVLEGEKTCARVHVEDLPMDQAHLAEMDREELMAVVLQLIDERDEVRSLTLNALLNFLFGDGPDPIKVSERGFILARAVAPENVWKMKQWEAGAIHGLMKQTWREMEKRLIEELLSRLATTGVFTMSGGKSQSARQRYAEDKKGNTSRKQGRKRGDTQAA